MEFIHINCDLGEGGEYDNQLMPFISACNIACGGHAGTLETMHETVQLAIKHQVEIGAHPSYPDKVNFGRKTLELQKEDLKRSLVAQILCLKQITEVEGGKLIHVKPHGALYNDAAKDEEIAEVVINALMEFKKDHFSLFAPLNSVISELAKDKMNIVFEAFADRNYEEDHSLVSRSSPHALITDKKAVFRHLSNMYFDKKIISETGTEISIDASTYCLHSDTPDSVEILDYLQQKFKEKNVQIQHL